MMRMVRFLALCTAILGLVGCADTPSNPRQPAPVTAEDFIASTYAAVDHLVTQLEGRQDRHLVRKPAVVIVATLVNIDELTESSRLGRSVSEQVAARLTQKGYQVVELKLRGNLFVQRSQGELLLSREVKDISLSHNAQAVVVGTYSTAKNFVHVNLKVVTGDTQHVLAATDYGLPLDMNTQVMLAR